MHIITFFPVILTFLDTDGSTEEVTNFGATMADTKLQSKNIPISFVITQMLVKVRSLSISFSQETDKFVFTGWMNEHGIRISMTHRRMPDHSVQLPKGVLKNNISPLTF